MSHLLPESPPTPAAESGPPAVDTSQRPPTPVLITEQEVVFGTAAAVSVPPAKTRRRWLGAELIAAIRRMSLTAPDKPRQHHPLSPSTRSSLEAARMSREMDRL
ncbi:MAG TPA: hypothetical protein VLZ05_06065 [Mycobacterium sp.]|jgi:hypothetical protein|nr:hypothetical protein [Mycobacterium sp.]HUH68471.1 hypothetical protein [Mycobacterium sp.]